ncbi:hypothetical protein SISSUDRAFT_1040604 [Sistotremastrum suecicum HHB10207 ss-3]|uniref:Secreted protein n=1 Tax=Sistotremastrum suecicum HHB10207 ss-3 TaxID=1314776 RepID=A0A166HX00_9AGAM|nr:hypothetical protein SISSUDRAFT_1040604 [Sistotremastrum suecicum HHB10207 ss-3]
MVMLTASLTALLALLSVTSSLALPTAPAQAHLAASPLLEADLLDVRHDPHICASNSHVLSSIGHHGRNLSSFGHPRGSPRCLGRETPGPSG